MWKGEVMKIDSYIDALQLRPRYDHNAWMDVSEAGDAGISVTVNNWKCPVYLARDGNNVILLHFENQKEAKEYLKYHAFNFLIELTGSVDVRLCSSES